MSRWLGPTDNSTGTWARLALIAIIQITLWSVDLFQNASELWDAFELILIQNLKRNNAVFLNSIFTLSKTLLISKALLLDLDNLTILKKIGVSGGPRAFGKFILKKEEWKVLVIQSFL